MSRRNSTRVWLLISIALTGGCAGAPRMTTVAEYPPHTAPAEAPSPSAGFFLLRQSFPATVTKTPGESHKITAESRPVTILTIYATDGEALGFRRANGQLLAVAGSSTRPLVDAHYTWESLPGRKGDTGMLAQEPVSDESDDDQYALDDFIGDLVSSIIDSAIDAAGESDGGHGSLAKHHDRAAHQHEHQRPRDHERHPTSRPAKD
jgi:hypothetical protein